MSGWTWPSGRAVVHRGRAARLISSFSSRTPLPRPRPEAMQSQSVSAELWTGGAELVREGNVGRQVSKIGRHLAEVVPKPWDRFARPSASNQPGLLPLT